jgi:hypothetical protein
MKEIQLLVAPLLTYVHSETNYHNWSIYAKYDRKIHIDNLD